MTWTCVSTYHQRHLNAVGSKRLKRLYHNALAKKTSIFIVIFVVTSMILGGKYTSMKGEEQLLSSAVRRLQNGQVSAATMETADRVISPNFPFRGEHPHIGTQKLPLKPLLDVRLPTQGEFVYCESIPLSYHLQQYTYNSCIDYGLEYELVLALMWRESRFQTDAVHINLNGTQDSGIMQINDVNREWLAERHGINDLMDPLQNIRAGLIILSTFTDKYGVHAGLMAYQYGEQGMLRKMEQGTQTSEQVALLIEKRDAYRVLLQNT